MSKLDVKETHPLTITSPYQNAVIHTIFLSWNAFFFQYWKTLTHQSVRFNKEESSPFTNIAMGWIRDESSRVTRCIFIHQSVASHYAATSKCFTKCEYDTNWEPVLRTHDIIKRWCVVHLVSAFVYWYVIEETHEAINC